jgi:hypothetical protein
MNITETLVRELIAKQFPHWSHLPIQAVENGGWDNRTFHLGTEMLVNPNTYQTTLIDLGEVVITHPFFSFGNCLYRATEHFNLSDTQYKQLQEACFQNWLAIESSAHLFAIIAIIHQCWTIHAVLGEYRLIKSVDPIATTLLCRQGRFAGKLRIWIEQSATIGCKTLNASSRE